MIVEHFEIRLNVVAYIEIATDLLVYLYKYWLTIVWSDICNNADEVHAILYRAYPLINQIFLFEIFLQKTNQ